MSMVTIPVGNNYLIELSRILTKSRGIVTVDDYLHTLGAPQVMTRATISDLGKANMLMLSSDWRSYVRNDDLQHDDLGLPYISIPGGGRLTLVTDSCMHGDVITVCDVHGSEKDDYAILVYRVSGPYTDSASKFGLLAIMDPLE